MAEHRGGFVSLGNVLSRIQVICNDREYNRGFTRYDHISMVKDALDELSIKLAFVERFKDFSVPKDSLRIEIPEDCYSPNISWLFNGENCVIGDSTPIHFMQNFRRGLKGGYTRNRRYDGVPDVRDSSPFFQDKTRINSIHSFNLVGQWIELTDDCVEFDNLRFTYDAYYVENEVENIPKHLKEAVAYYVADLVYEAWIDDTPGLNNKYLIVRGKKEQIWEDKRIKAAMMTRAERRDVTVYTGRMGF